MKIDIYIKEAEGSREVRIPWLPDKVQYKKNGTRMAQYEILDVGDVKVPSGSNLSGFFWESVLPGAGHKDLPFLRGRWREPKKIQAILDDWCDKGTPLRLIMTGTPINHDVYLVDFSGDYESGYGDFKYAIEFEKRRGIKIIATAAPTKTEQKSSTETKATSNGKTHTVKSGDTLWAIARKYLGSGAKYGTIYNLNKTIIEETAKKRGYKSSNGGHWIFPGQVLQIP